MVSKPRIKTTVTTTDYVKQTISVLDVHPNIKDLQRVSDESKFIGGEEVLITTYRRITPLDKVFKVNPKADYLDGGLENGDVLFRLESVDKN